MDAYKVVERCRAEGVELIRFIYCDFSGVQRGKVTSIDDLEHRLAHGINLTKAQMAFTLVNTVVPIEGMPPVGELRMVPDPETFAVLPWAPSHASMVCDLVDSGGGPYDACPRTWLKGIIDTAAARGIRVQAAFEDEFYLGVKDPASGKWVPADDSGIYAEVGLDYQAEFLTDMTRTLRAIGLKPEMVYHEGGPGQQEVSIRHAAGVQAADNQMKLRAAVRGVALKHGYHASFAPKPFPWTFGTGAHVHLSLWDEATGKNLMYDAAGEGGISQTGRHFIGGLLRHLPGLLALTCPSYNSYRRLAPRSWSTSVICWGFDNRQAAVRVASPFWGREEETTNIEIKASDGSSNPYLSLGRIIACGLDGIDNAIDPGPPLQADPADVPPAELEAMGLPAVPASLREAVTCFAGDPLFRSTMPDLMWRAHQEVKLAECEAFDENDLEYEINQHFYAF